MSFRGFLVLLLVLVAVNVTGELVGDWFEYATLFAMLLLLPILGWVNRRIVADLARDLREWTPFARDQFLLYVEEWEDRAEVVDALSADLPRVPIRGECERYRYEAGGSKAMTVMGWFSTFVFIFVVLYALQDPDRVLGAWYDNIAVFLGFSGCGAFFFWSASVYRREYVVDDQGITEVRDSVKRHVPWSEVCGVKRGWFGDGLQVRTETDKVGFSSSIDGYARLVNIVLSRVPPTTWRKGDT